MNKLYVVNLSDEEREGLRDLVKKGKVSARTLARAHILLMPTRAPTTRRSPRRRTST